MNDQSSESRRLTVQLKSEQGECLGTPFDLPISVTTDQLQQLCNQLFVANNDDDDDQELVPCAFYADQVEIRDSIDNSLKLDRIDSEKVLDIVYQPQAVFKVMAVTRCTSSLPGHGEPIVSVQFSPDGRGLASGSGDTTVRFWDTNTELPAITCTGHKHWVLCICWAPDGTKLASGCKAGQVFLWNAENGRQFGRTLTGHKKWITCLAWEPIHVDVQCRSVLMGFEIVKKRHAGLHRLASSSKDGDIRIWDTIRGNTQLTLAGHTSCVTCIRWGGQGILYSSSQDRTVKVWRVDDGILCRTLQGHGHWVNTMALNVDYVLRTGAFTVENGCIPTGDVKNTALERYRQAKGADPEILVSGSDDFTLFLWRPAEDKKPVARMTGHQQLINQVQFSPDTRIIASASFDKSIKLWCGKTGKYFGSLRGHIQAVYQVAWSADSRLLVSGSADSTLKVWNVHSKRLAIDLPGHADQVFAIDWSPDGQRVVSGGKDKVLKLWRQ